MDNIDRFLMKQGEPPRVISEHYYISSSHHCPLQTQLVLLICPLIAFFVIVNLSFSIAVVISLIIGVFVYPKVTSERLIIHEDSVHKELRFLHYITQKEQVGTSDIKRVIMVKSYNQTAEKYGVELLHSNGSLQITLDSEREALKLIDFINQFIK